MARCRAIIFILRSGKVSSRMRDALQSPELREIELSRLDLADLA